MSFWDELAEREAQAAPPSAQNAPTKCEACGIEDADVLLGSCGPCFAAWEAYA